MQKFWTKSFVYRLGGNAGLTFIAPFSGINIVAPEVELIQSIFISLISTTVVTAAVIFRRLEKWGNRFASHQ